MRFEMSVISKTTKARAAGTAAKLAARNPGAVVSAARPAGKLSLRVGKPILKRRARQRAQDVGETGRTVGQVLAVYGPMAARELHLVEPPHEKKTAPRVAAGAVLGASAVYFLEPGSGAEHRRKVAELVRS